jgi:hypothetical protein
VKGHASSVALGANGVSLVPPGCDVDLPRIRAALESFLGSATDH